MYKRAHDLGDVLEDMILGYSRRDSETDECRCPREPFADDPYYQCSFCERQQEDADREARFSWHISDDGKSGSVGV